MDDLDLTLKALGTQLKPIIQLVETMPIADRPRNYATAINNLAGMAGEGDAKTIKLGIAIALQRMGADKDSVTKAARLAIAI